MKFVFELEETKPEQFNRLRRLMMAFEQMVNTVMPEFRVYLKEE